MPPRHPRRHLYALLVAVLGALAAALAAGSGPAVAASPPTVTFNGGCGVDGVGGASEPDADSLTVPAEGLVVFVNHLGQTATLMVDDRASGLLRAGQEVPVVFHHGPVTIKLAPTCIPVTNAVPVNVRVSQRPGATGVAAAGRDGSGRATAGHAAGRRHGASGILLLVAAICVVGGSVATIRAIIAQRAIRTAST